PCTCVPLPMLILCLILIPLSFIFLILHTPPTEIYTLSLHDALPISVCLELPGDRQPIRAGSAEVLAPLCQRKSWRSRGLLLGTRDRKSTRLNSSHDQISYAVFCLKKKKKNTRKLNIHPTQLSMRHVY